MSNTPLYEKIGIWNTLRLDEKIELCIELGFTSLFVIVFFAVLVALFLHYLNIKVPYELKDDGYLSPVRFAQLESEYQEQQVKKLSYTERKALSTPKKIKYTVDDIEYDWHLDALGEYPETFVMSVKNNPSLSQSIKVPFNEQIGGEWVNRKLQWWCDKLNGEQKPVKEYEIGKPMMLRVKAGRMSDLDVFRARANAKDL